MIGLSDEPPVGLESSFGADSSCISALGSYLFISSSILSINPIYSLAVNAGGLFYRPKSRPQSSD